MDAFLDGKMLFENIDISMVPDAGRVALKVASFGEQYTGAYFKDIHYTGQKSAE